MKTTASASKHLAAVALGAGILAAGCVVGAPGERSGSEYAELSSACADDAADCAQQCFADVGIDADALAEQAAACAEALAQCVEDAAGDPAALEACKDEPACDVADLEAAIDGLTACLAVCKDDFDACLPDDPGPPVSPDPPDLDVDGLLECVEQGSGCFADCGGLVSSCGAVNVDCDADALADCLAAVDPNDPLAALECVSDAVDQCAAVDLSCVEDGLACFGACGPALLECFDAL
jgi:hypothetical protein